MSLVLNHNIAALGLHRNLQKSAWGVYKSMEKLASGLAINTAADNPAGLVISEQMRTQIASLNQEIENVSNDINRYRTADSALMEMRSHLTELRSLAVAAANEGGIDENMRQAYQNEANNIGADYNRIRETASFGTRKLLDGTEGSVANVSELPAVDFSSAETTEASMRRIDDEIARLDNTLSNVGAVEKYDLESRLSNLRVTSENLTAAESSIRDLDYAKEYSTFLRNQMLFSSGISLMAHTRSSPELVIALMSGL